MSDVEILLAVAGFVVTALVVAGMILLTPRGQVPVHADGDEAEGSNLSTATAAPKAATARRPARAVPRR